MDESGERTPLKATTLSLRFPAAATDGIWDSGNQAYLKGDPTANPPSLATRLTSQKPEPTLVKPYYPKGAKKPEAGENGYWKSVLEYQQRPFWLLRMLALNCCFHGTKWSITRAQWIWLANLLCLAVHTVFASLVFIEGDKNPEGMKVRIWRLSANWTDTSANGYTAGLVDNALPIRLDYLTASFFTLSAVAHAVVVVLGPFDRWIFYYWRQIDLCFLWWYVAPRRNPRTTHPLPFACHTTPHNATQRHRRWIEYSASGSIMAVGVALICGLREQNALSAVFMLMWGTMMCGLLTELWSRPRKMSDNTYDMNTWLGDVPDNAPETSTSKLSDDATSTETKNTYFERLYQMRIRRYNYVYRMVPHVIGIFLYVAAWWIVVNHFVVALADLEKVQPDIRDRVPTWVIWAFVGTIVIFSLFALPQIYYQWEPPRRYWEVELWYCLLSATAKVYLGGLLYVNVIMVGSVDEALTFLNVTALDVPLANLSSIV